MSALQRTNFKYFNIKCNRQVPFIWIVEKFKFNFIRMSFLYKNEKYRFVREGSLIMKHDLQPTLALKNLRGALVLFPIKVSE